MVLCVATATPEKTGLRAAARNLRRVIIPTIQEELASRRL